MEKARLMMAMVRSVQSSVIILDNLAEGLTPNYEYINFVNEVKNKETLILNLAPTRYWCLTGP